MFPPCPSETDFKWTYTGSNKIMERLLKEADKPRRQDTPHVRHQTVKVWFYLEIQLNRCYGLKRALSKILVKTINHLFIVKKQSEYIIYCYGQSIRLILILRSKYYVCVSYIFLWKIQWSSLTEKMNNIYPLQVNTFLTIVRCVEE